MTAKPICVVYLPPADNGNKITWEMCGEIAIDFEESRPDYYWFFFPGNNLTEVGFKVFYEKDFTPIQYEELKELIKKAIEK